MIWFFDTVSAIKKTNKHLVVENNVEEVEWPKNSWESKKIGIKMKKNRETNKIYKCNIEPILLAIQDFAKQIPQAIWQGEFIVDEVDQEEGWTDLFNDSSWLRSDWIDATPLLMPQGKCFVLPTSKTDGIDNSWLNNLSTGKHAPCNSAGLDVRRIVTMFLPRGVDNVIRDSFVFL